MFDIFFSHDVHFGGTRKCNLSRNKFEPPYILRLSGVFANRADVIFFSCSTQLSMKFQNAHKYKNIKKFSFFSGSDKHITYFFLLINVNMATTVSMLTLFMSKKKLMLSRVEHETSFITLGPDL